ncbi:hypothetical protein DB41_EY00240 [Neochlamydia sp. TUME1]|nr:hypothetical protein DB41_EY00240 [Neochlamydia sp. TUME1]
MSAFFLGPLKEETLKVGAITSYILTFSLKNMEKPVDLNSYFKLNNLFVMRRS